MLPRERVCARCRCCCRSVSVYICCRFNFVSLVCYSSNSVIFRFALVRSTRPNTAECSPMNGVVGASGSLPGLLSDAVREVSYRACVFGGAFPLPACPDSSIRTILFLPFFSGECASDWSGRGCAGRPGLRSQSCGEGIRRGRACRASAGSARPC